MNRNFILLMLLTFITLIGCTSNQARKTDPTDVAQVKAKTAYCPVNLFDKRDVLSCFDSREVCEKSISRAPKYVCDPLSSLKYPPKK
jgi:hypothetical protein